MSLLLLIGLPGSGKTTVGRMVAEALDLPFYDGDDAVIAAAGMSIPAIFERGGEAYFRALERKSLQDLCRNERGVIATGGGAVLSAENRTLLRQSGTVLWLDRKLENMMSTDFTAGRPLLKGGAAALEQLSRARRDLYAACAHHRIPDGDIDRVVAEILRIWREERHEAADFERPESEPVG